jgi:hypothetical protein
MEAVPITRVGLRRTPRPGSSRIFQKKVADARRLDACPAVPKANLIEVEFYGQKGKSNEYLCG